MQTRNTKLIIFSDLDGSLLDHETYHKKKFMIPPHSVSSLYSFLERH